MQTPKNAPEAILADQETWLTALRMRFEFIEKTALSGDGAPWVRQATIDTHMSYAFGALDHLSDKEMAEGIRTILTRMRQKYGYKVSPKKRISFLAQQAQSFIDQECFPKLRRELTEA